MNVFRNNNGFTLIEVCFAVLIVGLGLLTIFSLFPSGLRMAEDDLADTKCALFSEMVFSGLHANAANMTNATDWASGTFVDTIKKNVLGPSEILNTLGSTVNLQSDDAIRYNLVILDVPPYSAKLNVWYGKRGLLTTVSPSVIAYTEFYQSYQAK